MTLSALTLAHMLELSHRLAYDTRLWAHLASPDALYRYFGTMSHSVATTPGTASDTSAAAASW